MENLVNNKAFKNVKKGCWVLCNKNCSPENEAYLKYLPFLPQQMKYMYSYIFLNIFSVISSSLAFMGTNIVDN